MGPKGPSLKRTVYFGRAARAAALEALRRTVGYNHLSDILHHTPSGGHRHAHWVGEDRDGDGAIDHLAVWAYTDLDTFDVLGRAARISIANGTWHLEEVVPADPPVRLWVSATPFVGPNHAWTRSRKLRPGQSLAAQARAQIEALPDAPAVDEIASVTPGVGSLRTWIKDPTAAGVPPHAVWGHLAVMLTEARSVPFAGGVLSHWGLGAFRPAKSLRC